MVSTKFLYKIDRSDVILSNIHCQTTDAELSENIPKGGMKELAREVREGNRDVSNTVHLIAVVEADGGLDLFFPVDPGDTLVRGREFGPPEMMLEETSNPLVVSEVYHDTRPCCANL